MPRPFSLAAAGALFFVSGATGLVYQVLWARELARFFGSTTEAVSVVLATFMAGLGLGAHFLGRRADSVRSPLRFYGVLEVGVGLYALVVGPLIRGAGTVFSHFGLLAPAASVLLKLALSALVLIPPCALMGATLPALLRAVSESAAGARRALGLLYGLNLLGALAGTLATGFLLLELVGVLRTTLGAVTLNLVVGGIAIAFGRNVEDRPAPPSAPSPSPARPVVLAFVFVGLFVSGATTLGFEVVFARVLGLVFGVSSYAFSLTLAVFLLGLCLGALLERRLALRASPRQFALVEIAVAAAGGLALLAVPAVPRLVLYLRQIPGLTFWEILVGKGTLAIALLLPLAVLSGLGVPLLLGLITDDLATLGGRVGVGYLVNTAGTVAGSLLTGFVFIALWGTEGALKALLLSNAALGLAGVLLFGGLPRVRALGAVAALAAGALVAGGARWPALLFLRSDTGTGETIATTRLELEQTLRSYPNEVLFFREGRDATIAVTQTPNVRSLVVNGHPDGSDYQDMSTQLMLGVIPLAAHAKPEDVLVIGFGTGVTARTAVRVPDVARVDVLEIERAVLDAAPLFSDVNGGVERDPKVRVIVDDARSFVAAAPRRYDVVISEPSNPWRAGVANLYTEDFFRDVLRSLKPGGIFAQWMHLYSVDDATLRVVLKTVSAAFPEVQVFWLDQGNVVILASASVPTFDTSRVRSLLDGEFAADRVLWARLGTADELFGRYLMGTAEVRAFVKPSDPIHTDDTPVLEFRAPRGILEADGQNPLRLLAAKLSASAMAPPMIGAPPPPEALWLAVAGMYGELDRTEEAAEALRRAIAAGGPLAHIRAADFQLKARNMAGAAKQLESLQEGRPRLSRDEARELAYSEARFLAEGRRVEGATAAYQATGEMDGPAGVELLSLLVSQRRTEPAFALAERLLRAARRGGPITPALVREVDGLLLELGADPATAGRAAEILERWPEPSQAYPRLPRLRVLMALYERLGKPADALHACEEVEEMGILDAPIIALEKRALLALGRTEEAARCDARLRSLSSFIEPVPSPLTPRPPERPAPDRAPGS